MNKNDFSVPFGDGKVTFEGVTDEALKKLDRMMELGNRHMQARLRYWRLANDIGKQYAAEVVGLGRCVKQWDVAMERCENMLPSVLEVEKHHQEIGMRLASIVKLTSLWFGEVMSPDAYDGLEAFALYPKSAKDEANTAVEEAKDRLRKAGIL